VENFINSQPELTRLLKIVTPSIKVHQNYLDEVELFINSHNDFSNLTKGHGQKPHIKKLKLVHSEVFNREYLVAFADDDWFNTVAYPFNAATTPSLLSYNLPSPPLVIVSEINSRAKNKNFLSILEHEFVHVNQAIQNNFPDTSNFSHEPFRLLINYTFAEYQAYFIQYYHFPEVYKEALETCDYSLENFSIVRGYVQALEALVLNICLGQLSSHAVDDLLKTWRKQLPSEFKQMGLPEIRGGHYAVILPTFLNQAITQLSIRFPSKPINDGFLALTRWISANPVPEIPNPK
jgi:hypothetical protein